jgi:hypothetical protein
MKLASSIPIAPVLLIVLALTFPGVSARADQVEMRNGDRYAGNVVSLNTNTLVLESPVLGTLRLSRHQVAVISLGAGNPASPTARQTQAGTNAPGASAGAIPDLSSTLNRLNGKPESIQDIRNELLKDAGPEATQKFNELLGGFLTGRITVNDLRAQAQSLSDQVRTLRKDLGEDVGASLDGYLAILDKFLRESAPAPGANNTTRPAKP